MSSAALPVLFLAVLFAPCEQTIGGRLVCGDRTEGLVLWKQCVVCCASVDGRDKPGGATKLFFLPFLHPEQAVCCLRALFSALEKLRSVKQIAIF